MYMILYASRSFSERYDSNLKCNESELVRLEAVVLQIHTVCFGLDFSARLNLFRLFQMFAHFQLFAHLSRVSVNICSLKESSGFQSTFAHVYLTAIASYGS